jgi:hypothetical protein
MSRDVKAKMFLKRASKKSLGALGRNSKKTNFF